MYSKRFVKTIIRGSRTGFPFQYGAFANKYYVYFLFFNSQEGWYKILRSKISDALAITAKCQSTHCSFYWFSWIKTDQVKCVFQDVFKRRPVRAFNGETIFLDEYYYQGEVIH